MPAQERMVQLVQRASARGLTVAELLEALNAPPESYGVKDKSLYRWVKAAEDEELFVRVDERRVHRDRHRG